MFTMTDREALLTAIADRAVAMDATLPSPSGITMAEVADIVDMADEACPMDLARLFQFEDFNFAHDVWGLLLHLNRETGTIENCFLPRCAKKQSWVLMLVQFGLPIEVIGPFDSLGKANAHAEEVKAGKWFVGKSETEYWFHELKPVEAKCS